MNKTEALAMTDRLFLEMEALWGRTSSVRPEAYAARRNAWAKSLIHSDSEDIVAALGMFTESGAKHPPGLPEFKHLVVDLGKQRRLQDVKRIETGTQTPEIAEYYKMVIKRVLKVKGGSGFPWLEKIEDATDEQLDLIRSDLGTRGISVKPYAEFA